MFKAHRLAYEFATGRNPGPTIDHICHDPRTCQGLGDECPHRRCCNPAHLVPAGIGENAGRDRRRSETCRRGHPWTEENTYEYNGQRHCRACLAQRRRRRYADAVAQANPGRSARSYRPRGMSAAQVVEWGLSHADRSSECWRWPGPRSFGYVSTRIDGVAVSVHRLVYEHTTGPIPDGFVIDHVCHDPMRCSGGDRCPHRMCVNPAHLAAVPAAHNTAAARSARRRPWKCRSGHEFTDENTYIDPTGARHCRTCGRARNQRRRRASGSGRQ
jgi:hypothetical protein